MNNKLISLALTILIAVSQVYFYYTPNEHLERKNNATFYGNSMDVDCI